MADLRRLLEPRSIAVVGASPRRGSFGDRMTSEVLRSPSTPTVHLVNPAYTDVQGRRCVPTLDDLDEPVDLVMLGVPDRLLPEQLAHAAGRRDGAAVVFGTAAGLGDELASIAWEADMALCGGGGMGFVNVSRGVRAIGYVERFPLQPGGIAVVTHSGSVFSALLRTHRRLEYSLVVSSGQELVTTTADYLSYALQLEETKVVGLFLETLRDVDALRKGLAEAAERDIPVVALTVGGSPTGRALVNAHSGALAGDDAAWEALFTAYGVQRVHRLDELVDSLELFAIGRRIRPGTKGGLATVHDSGGERALVADRAHALGVPFAELSDPTRRRLAELLDPGLAPDNPLDVWGRGVDTERLFASALQALAEDEGVAALAVGLDLVEEYDGDEAYPAAIETVLARTGKPLAVLANLAASVDQRQAAKLRAIGVPVLEGTDSGLRALRHLLDQAAARPRHPDVERDEERARRWCDRLTPGDLDGAAAMALLADYGVTTTRTATAVSRHEAIKVATEVGFPVVLKTDEPDVTHKTDVNGVFTDLEDAAAVGLAYDIAAERLGPRVVVQHQVNAGVEMALGVVRDPLLGPLVVVAAGGTLVEVVQQRRVALPPLTGEAVDDLLTGLPELSALLGGVRGRPSARRDAVVEAVVAIGQLAVELGDVVEAVDVNPLICGPDGAVAVDALVVRRPTG